MKQHVAALKKISLLGYLLITLTSCMAYSQEACGTKISQTQLKTAEEMVLSFISDTVSVQQVSVFEETYRLTRSEICGEKITLYYEPNPNFRSSSDPNALSYPTGSRVKYYVNLKKREVNKEYLD